MTLSRHCLGLTTLIVAGLAAGLSPAHATDSDTDSEAERNRQFIAQAFQQWAAGGTTFFQDVLSPDVVWTITGSGPAAGTYRSRDVFIAQAVAPFAARLSSPIRPVVKDIWAEGRDVVVHWDGSAVAADGADYRNSYVWIFRMSDQRATEVTAFLDLAPYDDVIRRIALDPTADSPVSRKP